MRDTTVVRETGVAFADQFRPGRRHDRARGAVPAIVSPESAPQQPTWHDSRLVEEVRRELARAPGLVTRHETATLRRRLGEVARGHGYVVQAGDCAEDPDECTPHHLSRKVGLLYAVAGVVRMTCGRPVVTVGRIAGQFAKPRSRPTEHVAGVELPAYRGALVNGVKPDPWSRRPDPERMRHCHRAATEAMRYLRGGAELAPVPAATPAVWTSHEALLLDYELPQVRRVGDGWLLTSTHWPWVGERTRDPDGVHVTLLAKLANPVACKIGPEATADEVLALAGRLDPGREPGRLTFIVRFGAHAVADRLPALVAAVRRARHPVIWMCDPMHGNTVVTAGGRKTRRLEAVVAEVRAFQQAVSSENGVGGGLHLEATPDPVTECLSADDTPAYLERRYTTLCDPRLNPEQAMLVAGAWR